MGAQVLFCNYLMVGESYGAYAGKDEVLCNFVGKGFERDDEDVGSANSAGVSQALLLWGVLSR